MKLKILVTGKNGKVAGDICNHLERDRGYITVRCEPSKSAIFDVTLAELPKVIIICTGDETRDTVQIYNILKDVVRQGQTMVIVIANNEDEKLFIKYSDLSKVLFLSRPVSLFALYEKMNEIEEILEENREKNLSAFTEYVNENAFKRKNILVVDDDSEQLANIKEQLDEFYNVTCVKNGDSVFRFLLKKRPDMILLDYMMPEMDGPDVLRKIRTIKDYEDIPVVFLTGMAERTAVLKLLTELKPQGYIVKPAKKSKLVAKIIDVLG